MLGDQGSGPMVPAQDLRPGVPNGTRNGTRNRDPIPYFDSHLETSEGPGLESHGEPLNTEFNPRAYNRDPESGCPAPTRPTCQSPNTPGPREPGYIYIYIYIYLFIFFFHIYMVMSGNCCPPYSPPGWMSDPHRFTVFVAPSEKPPKTDQDSSQGPPRLPFAQRCPTTHGKTSSVHTHLACKGTSCIMQSNFKTFAFHHALWHSNPHRFTHTLI